MSTNTFGAAAKPRSGDAEYEIYRLAALEDRGIGSVARLHSDLANRRHVRIRRLNIKGQKLHRRCSQHILG